MLRARRAEFVAGLSDDEYGTATQALADRVISRLGPARILAGYISIGDEFDPAAILAVAAAVGVTIALPHVTDVSQRMRFLAWRPSDPLLPGPYGLLQPPVDAESLAPDVVLLPLIGFDRALHRLGQGAGHYDRALEALPDARRIGLAWSVQELPSLPQDPWDIALHAVATEQEWIER
jgi:5-formyltetrahydrofolate cyclo-ligase